MKSQTGYLDVVGELNKISLIFFTDDPARDFFDCLQLKSIFSHIVPPDILDYQTSHDMVVQEGDNVTLTCAAAGSPLPTIEWRREKGKPLLSVESKESN